MQIRFEVSRRETSTMNSSEIRENFLIEKLFDANQINLVYTHYDRVIAGGVMPTTESVVLPTYNALKADYFLERREIGIINVSDGDGEIIADNQTFTVRKLDCVYLGKGTKNVEFRSLNAENPARFFVLSAPAHKDYPNKLMTRENASPVDLGSVETANQRTIYKYIHLDGLRSCQLVMGLTVLKTGSVWNTMPSHVHDRRMEVYCYFDVPQNHAVCHLMGEPTDTKHIWVHNHQAIISPPWSIHSGCGTSNYSFIWGMAGENQVFTDMDAVAIDELR
jgi:4-deoxy-L-threo-5-hexosulose-uronate ketol-isomerase